MELMITAIKKEYMHEDGWGYHVWFYEDIVAIDYIENGKTIRSITFPTDSFSIKLLNDISKTLKEIL